MFEPRKRVLGFVRILRPIWCETLIVESSRFPASASLREHDHPTAIIEVLRQCWTGHCAGKHRRIIASACRAMIEQQRRERTRPIGFERHHFKCDLLTM